MISFAPKESRRAAIDRLRKAISRSASAFGLSSEPNCLFAIGAPSILLQIQVALRATALLPVQLPISTLQLKAVAGKAKAEAGYS